MYARVVRANVLRTFAAISRGDYMVMVDSLAPQFVYLFHGAHALGGRRTSRAAMIRWWERIVRLLPDLQFTVQEVLVRGWPWRTRVAIRNHISGALPDGTRYENTILQFMTIEWGKVSSIESLEDLQQLDRALAVVAASGQPEALAAPITD